MNINSDELLERVSSFIKNQPESKKDSMNLVLEDLKNYINGDSFVLTKEFQDFSLKNILSNNYNQLEKLTLIVDLFLKMNKQTLSKSHPIPKENPRSGNVYYHLEDCLKGIKKTRQSFDYDNDVNYVELEFQNEIENIYVSMSSYGVFNMYDENDEEIEDNSFTYFCKLLNITSEYDSIGAYIYIKYVFDYIDIEKVKEKLQQLLIK